MNKKMVSLAQLEEALRDFTRWIKDKLEGYVEEPPTEGESGWVLTTNGAGGRSWTKQKIDEGVWKPSVSAEGVLSWEKTTDEESPEEVNVTGPQGEQGPQGVPGPQGPKGDTGPQGEQGPRGLQGIQGEKGDKGDKGEKGNLGLTGPTGPQGPKGDKGDPFTYSMFTAEQLKSLTGPKGDTGATGPKGEKGDKGDKGDTGATGATGPQGEKGEKGDKGDPGSGASSWDELTGKPFGEISGSDTLEWDGSTEGRVTAQGEGEDAIPFYKISDAVFTQEDCANGGRSTVCDASGQVLGSEEWTPDWVYVDPNGVVALGTVASVPESAVASSIFPEAGTYFAKNLDNYVSSFTINGYTGFTNFKPIPYEYMPAGYPKVGKIDKLTWDGNTEGLTVVDTGYTYYKVSENSPSYEALLAGGSVDVSTAGGETMTEAFTDSDVGTLVEGAYIVTPSEIGTTVVLCVTEDSENAEKGTYLFNVSGMGYVSSLRVNGYQFETVTPMDPKFLPAVAGEIWTPSVSAEGVLSWAKSEAEEAPASVNIKGPKGDTGATGATGPQGPQGETGAAGPQGEKGDKGDAGENGYTPVKGTDYWTAADKSAMVSDVLAALPTWTGGSY